MSCWPVTLLGLYFGQLQVHCDQASPPMHTGDAIASLVDTSIEVTGGGVIEALSTVYSMLSGIVQDVAKFYLLVGLVQLIMYFSTLVPDLTEAHGSPTIALLELLVVVINAARPVLPAVLVFVRIVCLMRLRYQGVTVSNTQMMLTAGHLDVVLFDKTGTLTVEQVSKPPQ